MEARNALIGASDSNPIRTDIEATPDAAETTEDEEAADIAAALDEAEAARAEAADGAEAMEGLIRVRAVETALRRAALTRRRV